MIWCLSHTHSLLNNNNMTMIIAMKGHPGTGKSTIARSISSALKVPLIDKDDVRDSTLSLQHSLNQITSPSTASSLLNDLSYEAIFRLASTQLQLGLSVVVDSPLSRKSHLDRLLRLSSAAGARLVVVECKPSDEAEWRRRLERRGAAQGEDDGHKPSTWEELQRLLEGYGGCTEYDVEDAVAKLVVDTTFPGGFDEVVSDVIEFILSQSHGEGHHQDQDELVGRHFDG